MEKIDYIKNFITFRKNMKLDISYDKAVSIWGKKRVKGYSLTNSNEINRIVKEKIDITKKKLNILINQNVLFIGISGSIAAGFAKEDDDIDIFVVVKNNTAWIFRMIVIIKGLFCKCIRNSFNRNIKDKFCINFIVEERGLELEPDIFNFHELVYLIPVYNEEYLDTIFMKNIWMRDLYGMRISIKDIDESKEVGFVRKALNSILFYIQKVIMFILGHNSEIGRVKGNYESGRVQFYPEDFKKSVLKEL